MGETVPSRRPAKEPADVDLDAKLARIASLTIEELRSRWRLEKGREPPTALSKDLLARALAHNLQEKVLGGLDPRIKKIIAGSSPDGAPPPRRVKVGSVVVREYQGKLHEVLVVPDGFCWQGQVFASLTTIAQKITGTSWNGPRFFGLRGVKQGMASESSRSVAAATADPATRKTRSIPNASTPREGRGGA
jgi:hypothetical protein